jgi:prefoldin beta subunit
MAERERRELPPIVQNQLNQLQQAEDQIRVVSSAKQQLEIKLDETIRALKELENVSEGIYRSIGSLMIPAQKDKLVAELDEDRESLEVKTQSLGKQESRLRDRIQSLQQQIQESLRSAG